MRARSNSAAKQHAEWLSLVEVSGPFLTLSVLNESFKFGLDAHDSELYRSIREAYQEWDESQATAIHTAWIRFLLAVILGYPEECIGEAQAIPESAVAVLELQGERIRPDLAILDPDDPRKVKLPILVYPRTQKLDSLVDGSSWSASPHTRMQMLLQNTGQQAGFVTNGAQWSLVHVRKGEPTGFATWHTQLLTEEKVLLQAFRGILGVESTLGAPEGKSLFDLLDKSAQDQEEVTKELGRQVRQAVEVFVNALDRLDHDSGRTLLDGIEPKEVYNAALTVMMRLIFLLCAEERGLMDQRELYVQHYSVSALSDQLLEEVSKIGNEDVLEHRHDAWMRLLATFRLVHGGCQHEDLNLPAYGGSLFDPSKYPFLERCQIDNRVTLHLMDALEFLQIRVPGGGREKRRLSFRALGVEQIGHVYEGLLDHTALRANEPMLGLTGKETEEAEIAISTLETNRDDLGKFFEKAKIKVAGNVEKLLKQSLDMLKASKLRVACAGDEDLYQRVLPFLNLVREDSLDHLQVFAKGSLYVTQGMDRRASGTHYTPVSLTEEVVRYALEPQVYVGPAQGLPPSEWKLKSAREIIDLKVCDLAMGSGAFLVQACRFLSERLVEAWQQNLTKAARPLGFSAEGAYYTHPSPEDHTTKGVGALVTTPIGNLAIADPSQELISDDADERLSQARRIVADRCLYGVDINPMAVEMAKLSLWLTTMRRDRPFTFLDHALKCGDSLIGVSQQQLEHFSMEVGGQRQDLLLPWVGERVERANQIRKQLAHIPSHDPASVHRKSVIFRESESVLSEAKLAADLLLAKACYPSEIALASPELGAEIIVGVTENTPSTEGRHLVAEIAQELLFSFEFYNRHRPFHWHLEFPEVFAVGGFDLVVGNPPFIGGWQISTYLGANYPTALKVVRPDSLGRADLVAHFFRRSAELLSRQGIAGLISNMSIREVATREFGLDRIIECGSSIFRARTEIPWPGKAAIYVCLIHFCSGTMKLRPVLNGKEVDGLDGGLSESLDVTSAKSLCQPIEYCQGVSLYGRAFVLSKSQLPALLLDNPSLDRYLREYVNGDILNDTVACEGAEWVVDFGDREITDIEGCDSFLSWLQPQVLAERANQKGQVHESRPWLHWDKRLRFLAKARKQDRIIVASAVSSNFLFDLVPSKHLYMHSLKMFLSNDFGCFGLLQSGIHECWAREMSSSRGRSIRYSTTKCFDTFPFPDSVEPIHDAGWQLYETRQGIRNAESIGLNQLYDRLHDKIDSSDVAKQMRDVLVDLDKSVLRAYGWDDLVLNHDHYGEGRDCRFTISPAARQEILRRLLKLNHERYAAEVAAGLHDKGSKPKRAPKPSKPNPDALSGPRRNLFDEQPTLGEDM